MTSTYQQLATSLYANGLQLPNKAAPILKLWEMATSFGVLSSLDLMVGSALCSNNIPIMFNTLYSP